MIYGFSFLFPTSTYYICFCLSFQAMVSGAIGGFLDVAFNFNTLAYLDDNLVGQLQQPMLEKLTISFSFPVKCELVLMSSYLLLAAQIGWKMVMHGDMFQWFISWFI